jgi:hypothetical protein
MTDQPGIEAASGPTKRRSRKPRKASSPAEAAPPPPRVTRGDTLIVLMRAEGGATATELAAAVGWQIHSVRGFIAGTLKKRADLTVSTSRSDGVTRYSVSYVKDRSE